MKRNLAAMTALAGSLVLTTAVSAGAAPVPDFKSSLGTGSGLVELAREGGKGGGGGGGMRSGGGMKSGGGGGAAMSQRRGGGGPSGRMSGRSYGGGDGLKGRGSSQFKGGRDSGRYAGRGWDDGDFKGRDGGKRWDGDKRRYSGRDHDGRNKHNRHRVWRNGAWVWVYGPAIYAYGDDCGWIFARAQATGSPYWWSRYEACVAYY
jgi:hypothetical protein